MASRYRIEHISRYEYDRSVTRSFNEARLTPLQTPWQTRLESRISVEPMTWSHPYLDYWGTEVRVFEVDKIHHALEVRASSLVELDATRRPAPSGDKSWAELRRGRVRDEFVEYLAQTPSTEPPAELADLADSIAADHPPVEAAGLIGEAVHAAVIYRSGVTQVHTTAGEAWTAGSGVCQDHAHLVVGALRHIGVPARYVSGYLHPSREPRIGQPTVGESHAWVEFWLGEWVAQDPTNLAPVGERHVMVGTGRDYADVPPIKGIVAGAHETVGLTVQVELTRLA